MEQVAERLKNVGLGVHLSVGEFRTIIGLLVMKSWCEIGLEALPFVEKILPITQPFKLVSREFQEEDSVFNIGNCTIGGKQVVLMAGPCAVESEEQVLEAALGVSSRCPDSPGRSFKAAHFPLFFPGAGGKGLQIPGPGAGSKQVCHCDGGDGPALC